MLKPSLQDFKYDLTSIRDECKCPVVWTFFSTTFLRTSLVAQMVKRLPTMQKTRVQSLGREDLLEKEMATHSSILAWKIPWMEEPVGYSPWGRKELDTTEWLHFHSSGGHAHLLIVWFLPSPGGSVVTNPPANAGDAGLIPASGRSPGEGNGNPLRCSGLENSMDRGAWWATVHGVAKSQTWLSDWAHTHNPKGEYKLLQRYI